MWQVSLVETNASVSQVLKQTINSDLKSHSHHLLQDYDTSAWIRHNLKYSTEVVPNIQLIYTFSQ